MDAIKLCIADGYRAIKSLIGKDNELMIPIDEIFVYMYSELIKVAAVKKPTVADRQLKYIWAHLYDKIQEHTGQDKLTIHDEMKQAVGFYVEVEIGGEKYIKLKSIAKDSPITNDERETYIDKVTNYADRFFNVTVKPRRKFEDDQNGGLK